jgi:hypothetical protein
MNKQQQQIEEELRQHQHDSSVWSDASDQAVVLPTQTSVVTVQMPKEEFFALVKAAKNAGESLSDYIRAAVKLRQGQEANTTELTWTEPRLPVQSTPLPWLSPGFLALAHRKVSVLRHCQSCLYSLQDSISSTFQRSPK